MSTYEIFPDTLVVSKPKRESDISAVSYGISTSETKCRQTCDELSDCDSFTYNSQTKQCVLHNNEPEFSHSEGFVTFRKNPKYSYDKIIISILIVICSSVLVKYCMINR